MSTTRVNGQPTAGDGIVAWSLILTQYTGVTDRQRNAVAKAALSTAVHVTSSTAAF